MPNETPRDMIEVDAVEAVLRLSKAFSHIDKVPAI